MKTYLLLSPSPDSLNHLRVYSEILEAHCCPYQKLLRQRVSKLPRLVHRVVVDLAAKCTVLYVSDPAQPPDLLFTEFPEMLLIQKPRIYCCDRLPEGYAQLFVDHHFARTRHTGATIVCSL